MLKLVYKLAKNLRKKRFTIFVSLLENIPRPIRILDIGGTQAFWEQMGFAGNSDVQIVLLNIDKVAISSNNIFSVVGDARSMGHFKDKEFTIAFSNSVIEHVGDFHDQKMMAEEVMRVAKCYFLQTPNRFFPIEPHFFFPFFQFLPVELKLWLATHMALGTYPRIKDEEVALRTVTAIRLLDRRELKQIFPGGRLIDERFLGLTKSLMVYKSWEDQAS